MNPRSRFKTVFLLSYFFMALPLFCDEVRMKNGDLLVGEIREITSKDLLIRTGYGPYVIRLDFILEVLFTPVFKGKQN